MAGSLPAGWADFPADWVAVDSVEAGCSAGSFQAGCWVVQTADDHSAPAVQTGDSIPVAAGCSADSTRGDCSADLVLAGCSVDWVPGDYWSRADFPAGPGSGGDCCPDVRYLQADYLQADFPGAHLAPATESVSPAVR